MPRFFIDSTPDRQYILSGEAGRHGAKVLRLRPGEAVTLCDGQGTDYPSTVRENMGDGLLLDVDCPVPSLGEPRTRVTVCQCLPKGDKLEAVVQKAVELGAHEIWPIESRYCVAKWDQKSREKKLLRLQKIALEAAMQSGRGIVPRVLEPAALRAALETAKSAGDILFFYEKASAGLGPCLAGTGDRIFLFIGPEGGFSEAEAAMAKDMGARIASLGPRILRTETAPIAALSAIFYGKGDMEP